MKWKIYLILGIVLVGIIGGVFMFSNKLNLEDLNPFNQLPVISASGYSSLTSTAQGVDIKPLGNNTLLWAFVNSSTGNASESALGFQTIFANGTNKQGRFLIDANVGNIIPVSLAPINSTHFYIGYMEMHIIDELRAIYDMNGTQLLAPTTVDGANTLFYDTCMSHMNNRTFFGWLDNAESDFDFVVAPENSTTTLFVGETSVDTGMAPSINSTNSMDCTGMNTSATLTARIDYASTPDTVTVSQWNFLGVQIGGDVIMDADVGTTGTVAVASTNNKNIIFWYDSADADVTMTINWTNGTSILAPTDVNTTAGTGSRIDVAPIYNASQFGVGYDNIVVVWYGQDSNDIMGATFDGFGDRIASDFVIDSSPNTTARFSEISVTGRNPSTNQSLCADTFAVAYSNSTGATVFKTYFVNGSTWDGNGCAWRTDTTPPQWSEVGVNDTQPSILESVKFSSKWTDNVALSNYTFSWNGTGALCDTWANDTPAGFSSGWANVTKEIPATCVGVISRIGWYVFANDTTNNDNATLIRMDFTDAPANCWTNDGTLLYIPNGCVYNKVSGGLEVI